MKNKRREPDFIIKTIESISLISWIVLFIIAHIAVILNPALRGMTFYKMPPEEISPGWLFSFSFMFIILIIINITGIVLNTKRLKRKTDRMKHALFYSVIFSITGIILIIRS